MHHSKSSSREAQRFSRYSPSCTQPPLHEKIRKPRNQDPKDTQHYTSVLTGSYPLRPPLRPAILPILAKTPLILFPCAPPELNPSSTSSLARRRLDSANPSGGTSYNYARDYQYRHFKIRTMNRVPKYIPHRAPCRSSKSPCSSPQRPY